ncbi:MAG TPA: sulfatase [Candidatus Binatia bacterium]|nr:sulfatase [Candidatus Binatia bacterium]
MSRTGVAVAVAVLVAAAVAASRFRHPLVLEPPAVTKPSLVLVTIDTERADHTSTYGYAMPTTPHLDALAAQGTVFTNAYAAIPSTAPSHASLFTSRYPSEHGVLRNGDVLDATTLTEILAGAGYATAGFVSAYPLARKFGYARGFSVYDDAFTPREASIVISEWEGQHVDRPAFDRRADATTARALGWLSATPRDRPLFLWVHYYDPHQPYDPPAPFRDAFAPAGGSGRSRLERNIVAYDGEIRFADEALGRLIHAVDERVGVDRTIVVVASDHGEGLMQHGWMGHGVDLYEELVRAVLVIRAPGMSAGRRCAAPVGLIDVAPTVLALLGLDGEALRPRGVDLGPALRGGAGPAPDRAIFFQRRVYDSRRDDVPVRGDMRAVRIGAWKYIEGSMMSPELFDLSADPAELRNVWDQERSRGADLAGVLAAWRRDAGDATAVRPLSAEEARRMRALGYVE